MESLDSNSPPAAVSSTVESTPSANSTAVDARIERPATSQENAPATLEGVDSVVARFAEQLAIHHISEVATDATSTAHRLAPIATGIDLATPPFVT
jgi:hypothetical protein